MKKLALICVVLIGGLLFTSCDDNEGAKLYEVTVEVMYPDGYDFDSKAGIPVKMSNMNTGIEVQAETNDQGIAAFSVESGSYNITSTFETEEFAFNGIIENRLIEEDDQHFDIQLHAVAKTGGFVISEVYFAGSLRPEGSNYNGDGYVEIYNNSDEVLYIDGVCIGVHGRNSISPPRWIDEDGNILDVIPITFQTWMFPGTGEDYPVEPRTAIVLAVDGINHQAEENNPNSPADLSNADFEAYVDHERDVDNPAVTNMVQIYTTSAAMSNWTLDVNGRSIPIFRLPTGLDYEAFVDNSENFMQDPTTGRGFFYLMAHVDWVIDAVEIVRPEEDRRHKQLPTVVDAGMVWNPEGKGHSIRRKVEKIIDGKVFLKDTNNSSEDWIGGVIPVPGEVPNVID